MPHPRSLVALVLLLTVLASAGPAGAAPEGLRPPVDGIPSRAFSQPHGRYGPGHRGVDLPVEPGAEVRAPGAGVVSFAGVVAGVRWVTVDHGGLRSTVGPLSSAVVRRGQRVAAGEVIGAAGTGHDGAVHWSVRRGDVYIDPWSLRPRPRATLLPL